MNIQQYTDDMRLQTYAPHNFHELAIADHLNMNIDFDDSKCDLAVGGRCKWAWHTADDSEGDWSFGNPMTTAWVLVDGTKLYEVIHDPRRSVASDPINNPFTKINLGDRGFIDPNYQFDCDSRDALTFWVREFDTSDWTLETLEDERSKTMFRIGECAVDGWIDHISRLQLQVIENAIVNQTDEKYDGVPADTGNL